MAEHDNEVKKDIQESFERLGKLMGDSLSQGIADGSGSVRDAADMLSRELLESQAQYQQEMERIEKENEAAQEAKYRRDYQNRLNKARTAAQAEIVIENERLRLQKKSNQEYLESLKAHLEEVEAQIQAYKQKITNSFGEIAENATDSLEALERSRERMVEKMQDYGGMFDERTITFVNAGPGGSKLVFEEMILDLSEERAELEEYASLLEQMKGMEEVPNQLFQGVLNLSVADGIRYMSQFLGMGDGERRGYLNDWKAIRDLSQQTAGSVYADQTKEVLLQVEQALTEWYGTIPEGFFREGVLAADAFGEGFVEKMQSLKNILQEAVSHVTSEAPGVWHKAENMAEKVSTQEKNVNITYVLNSAGETIAEQLLSARMHADIVKLRGE